jgi:N6-L-threonylcarbamoyladenine synthase
MIILGIETSCDETAVGIVVDGTTLISNVIENQINIHLEYGGIIPELASRQHIKTISRAVQKALVDSKLNWSDVDMLGVTDGPGLAGSLIVGVNFANGLSSSLGIPLIGINHLEGHVYASWIKNYNNLENETPQSVSFPIMCLIVSGGHTDLVKMNDYNNFELLGRTKDDAAGEAFDKAARVLGLGFPGGPEIEKVASKTGEKYQFPRAFMRNSDHFSFSGMKTALINLANEKIMDLSEDFKPSDLEFTVNKIANSFQDAMVDVLVKKTINITIRERCNGIILSGGVAANSKLRNVITESSPVPVFIPPKVLCTDNGAMIAACTFFKVREQIPRSFYLEPIPNKSW